MELLSSVAEEAAFDAGVTLWRLGETIDAAHIVVSGRLDVVDASGGSVELGVGETLGELQLLTGGLHSTTATTLEPVRLLRLPLASVRALVAEHPSLLHAISTAISQQLRAEQLVAALRRLFGSLDAAVEEDLAGRVDWVELAPGEVLFHQHEPGDALYMLVDGVVAAWADVDGSEALLNEIAPGETIGEISLISRAARSATVKAVKPSLLIRLGREDFEATAAKHPLVYKAFARVLGEYLVRSREGHTHFAGAREITLLAHGTTPDMAQTVALRIAAALAAIGPTLHLSVSQLHAMSDTFPFEIREAVSLPLHDPNNTRFSMWLTDQRRRFAFVLYEVDGTETEFDRLCIDRADEVVVVADATSDPALGSPEQALEERGLIPRRLVLVHGDETGPSHTHRWLAGRRLAGHHHVRLNRRGDFDRVARFLAGQATGLVLAGGGARGFAHIGVIRALHEAGVPIDSIGGTSSGAMCGLMYAMDPDPDLLALHNQRDWVGRKPLRKYGLPVLSILNHATWDRIFEEAFRDKNIEDLWIPAFCISSNIDAGRMAVHDTGPAWKAVRASSSLPALLAPVLFDGEAHVDGGLVNNLPTDVMRARTAGPVFAVSLGRRAADRMPFDVYPSPWRLATEVLNPMRASRPMHTLPKVMLQIAILGDLAKSELRSHQANVVFEPPVDGYSMTDFSDVDGVIRAGYEHASQRLETLAADEAFRTRLRAAGITL
jgi:predicted acylesterase/phospholipase RssA/CRP-like cAMP-binding protein